MNVTNFSKYSAMVQINTEQKNKNWNSAVHIRLSHLLGTEHFIFRNDSLYSVHHDDIWRSKSRDCLKLFPPVIIFTSNDCTIDIKTIMAFASECGNLFILKMMLCNWRVDYVSNIQDYWMCEFCCWLVDYTVADINLQDRPEHLQSNTRRATRS